MLPTPFNSRAGQKRWRLQVLTLTTMSAALTMLASAQQTPQVPSALDPTAYRTACRAIADDMLGRIYQDPVDWVVRHGKPHCVAHGALVQAMLWQWTGERRYASGASEFLKAVAETRRQTREADFFTVYPFMAAHRILERSGKLPDEVRTAAHAYALQCFRARDVGDHNQAFTRACGLELAAQQFPNAAAAEDWHRYAMDVWELWTEQGDITENAPNYNRIDAVYVFLLGDLLDRTATMRDPRIQAMFTRWRDQVTPSGTIPSYGDSGSGQRTPNPDWPINNQWGDWVAGMERAATFYQDGTFRWAAAKLFQRGRADEPLGRHYGDILSLSSLMQAAAWSSPALLPRLPAAGPWLQTRRNRDSANAMDKLILNANRQSSSPYVLCDLYSRGPHGHVNQHGGINWFESVNVPLVTSLGYNNRQPHHTNLLLVRKDNGAFPHRPPFAANRWHSADLPSSRLPRVKGKPHHRRLTELGLRITSRRGVTFQADNLRLSGPGGVQLIEGFESAEGWTYNPHPTGDATQGDYALVWQIPAGAHVAGNITINERLRSFEFDCREFPRLQIDWQLSDNAEFARPFILRCGVDYHAQTLQLQPELTDARVLQKENDQYGRLEFADWFDPAISHRRQMVLTEEGVLVVSDQLTTRAISGRHMAGPVWHFGPRRDPQRGRNWFNAVGAATELLVIFSEDSQRTFGVQSVDVWSITGQRTVYAKQPLKSGQQVTFVSVLMPHGARQKAEKLAESVAFHVADHSTTVHFCVAQNLVTVQIAGDTFQVKRSEKK